MAERLLPIQPPPGSVIKAFQGVGMPGASVPIYYLSYNNEETGKIIEWVRDLAMMLETQAHQDALQKVQPSTSIEEAKTILSGHDWGVGGYQIGKDCSKCKQKATGFEKKCIDQ